MSEPLPTGATRRALTLGLAAAGLARPARAAPRLTAADIVERIQAACAQDGVAWQTPTVDTFKIGDPNTPVTGIVTTFMGTLALMKQAVAAGANFIISHEPIFWNHRDDVSALADDPIYRAKTAYAREHGLVVFRFHDHWHRVKPEPMSTASTARLGWAPYLTAGPVGFSRVFERPPIRLGALAEEITERLPTRSLRAVGDPDTPVRRIATVGHGFRDVVTALQTCDAVLAPEIREWETVEYVRDLVAMGQPKALLMIAHERGEEDGMQICETWLRARLPGQAVRYMPSGEPFRTPRFITA